MGKLRHGAGPASWRPPARVHSLLANGVLNLLYYSRTHSQSTSAKAASPSVGARSCRRRVSSSDNRQVVDLQLDALLAAGVDERHLHQDKQSGGRDDRAGLKACLAGGRVCGRGMSAPGSKRA